MKTVCIRRFFTAIICLKTRTFATTATINAFRCAYSRLEVMPGERVAILGRNGAGNQRCYRPWRAAWRLSRAMSDSITRAWRRSIWPIYAADASVFLSQNARLFFGTLRENLTLGAPHASDAQIFEALEVSGAAAFVKQLAKGLAHPIMEGGNGLSGGVSTAVDPAGKNAAAIAQYRAAPDEPSASLDEHTEREFTQRLNQWLGKPNIDCRHPSRAGSGAGRARSGVKRRSTGHGCPESAGAECEPGTSPYSRSGVEK